MVGKASTVGSRQCTFEWLHAEKKRMRRVEEEDVEGSVHCSGGRYDYS